MCAVLTLVINFALSILEQKSILEILFVVGKKDEQNGRRRNIVNAGGWILINPLAVTLEKKSHQKMVKSHLCEKP